MDVRLFFYKKGNGSWNALVTTDMGIDANGAFKLYARRWCIEVAHYDKHIIMQSSVARMHANGLTL